jgi:predicted nucleotidyltransferase
MLPPRAIEAICRRNQIRRLALFGSVLREDFSDESDVDVLIKFDLEAKPGLFYLARMSRELTEIIGREVDSMTPGFLSPYFRQEVLD